MGNKLGIGGNNLILETCNNYKIYYYYDENNDLIGFKYNNQMYYYIRNAFKTIEKVIDNNGNIVISYRYDPYGKVIMTTKANNAPINHFLYKGYYYDDETDFYYLLSRYYYPEICRWISPDLIDYLDHQSINGLNLYCYCHNNPIMYYDPSGHVAISVGLLIAGFVIGALVGTASSIVTQGLTEGFDNINGWQVLLDGTIGGVSGLLAFSGIGAFGSALISGGLGFVGTVGGDLIRNNGDWSQVNWGKAAVMTGMNFLLGWGPGVQNSKAIGKSLSSTLSSNTGFKAISKALANPKASVRGIQGAFNLYGKSLAQGISSALPGIITSRMDDAFAVMLSTAVSTTLFEWGTDYFNLL